MATYKIHPGIGIARLGNSDTEFYLAPETPAGLPMECDSDGNQRFGPDGIDAGARHRFPRRPGTHQAPGRALPGVRLRREVARRTALKIGDQIEGGGNAGTLIDYPVAGLRRQQKGLLVRVRRDAWRAWLSPNHPPRNADVDDRNRLIIDPGPRIVDGRQAACLVRPQRRRQLCDDVSADRYRRRRHRYARRDDDRRPVDGCSCSAAMAVPGSEKTGPGEPHISRLRQQRRLVRRHVGRPGDGAARHVLRERDQQSVTSTSNIRHG